MADSSQEKTEEATPKRLREAKKKGQIARSRDLNTIALLIAGFALIVFLRGYCYDEFKSFMQANFDLAVRRDLTVEMLFVEAQHAAWSVIKISAPFLIGLSVVGIMISFAQSGPIFSGEPMKPQMKRINAIENLKNMFKMTTLIELIKNIAKIALIFFLAYLVISDSLRDVLLTVTTTPDRSVELTGGIVAKFLIKVFIVFIVIAIIDVMVQRWQYKKQMRMSKDEVKREYKQDEGDPLIKSMRRQMHREMATSDTGKAVKSADAVITNPTELAVAVKYNDQEMAAPQVVAKGQRLFAQAIRDMAQEAGVPIIQNVPLAWSLIEIEIGDEIPEELYATVAEVLLFVYKLKREQGGSTLGGPQSS